MQENIQENILIKSCVFHYEFEFVHPFSDGNGRMGRLFQTCLLSSKEEIFAYLPIESIIKERQQEYYDAIAKCNKVGNSNIFIEFMLDAILETIIRTGKKDNEDFWIKMGPKFIYIRYFAVRNKVGEFLGTLEVTQNIKPIVELVGEKRLMSN